MNIDTRLKEYIDSYIIPLYIDNYIGDGVDCIDYVISRAITIIKENKLDIDWNILYVAIAYHDIRKNNEEMGHELTSADMLVKQGYNLCFYKNDKGTVEMDFFIRDTDSLITIEVKANDNATISLKDSVDNNKYSDIKYGIKLCNKNIGFNGKFYTFPYFTAFLLKNI